MPPKNRVEQLLQDVKIQSKAMGIDVNGYQPKVARQGENVLAFVFYPTGEAILKKEPVLVTLKQIEPAVEIYPPYEGRDYDIQKTLWMMGADGHSFQENLEHKGSSD